MGVAVFVTFQKKIPKVNPWDMGGKTLATYLDELDRAAKKKKLPSLSQFWSGTPGDLEDLVGDKEERAALQKQTKWLKNKVGKSSKFEKKLWNELESALKDIEKVMDAVGVVRDLGPMPEQWFDPSDALPTVKFLQDHVRNNPKRFGRDHKSLLQDLTDVERFLTLAKRHKVMFHLCMDI